MGYAPRGGVIDLRQRAATESNRTMQASTLRRDNFHGLAPQDALPRSAGPADETASLLARYREGGYLLADVNPLGIARHADVEPAPHRFRHALRGGADGHGLETRLRQSYCEGLTLNAAHVRNHAHVGWLYERLEARTSATRLTAAKRLALYEMLFAAERLEHAIAADYPAAKRFSLEGSESYIVFLRYAIEAAAANGSSHVVLGMPHRGRLNVLANVMGLPADDLRSLFTDSPSPHLAAWDIKEHLGLARRLGTDAGGIDVLLAHNPSHLESVTPVVTGMVRAMQERAASDPRGHVLPIIVHGDASFSGQGIVTETLNLAGTRGYGVGGTVHVLLNNQIGSTVSNQLDARSTLNSADVARAYDVPVLHVNGDLPELVAQAAELAVQFRQRFHADILVDVVGYRRHGHNGHDDPRVTQPAMQRIVRSMPTVVQRYRAQLLQDGEPSLAQIAACERRVSSAQSLPACSVDVTQPSAVMLPPVRTAANTGATFSRLGALVEALTAPPPDFRLHEHIRTLAAGWRHAASSRANGVDWCLAETLAYASLLAAGTHVRLSGLDIGRGSFFHRQCVWHDQDSMVDGERVHVPLRNLGARQGVFSVFETPLSEEAVLGFEYGYSVMARDTLVAWEAQFGDFVNNAQVLIDQFISCGEAKWGYRSGLTMLLPHGNEGGGPEHSSAYVGRFLSLCAEHNMIVCMPSTSAQLFHLLRRQAMTQPAKPLVVFTPKGQLYGTKASFSGWSDFETGGFRRVIGDIDTAREPAVERVVLCSGKIHYALEAELAARPDPRVALLRLEQLYPLPAGEIRERLARLPRLAELVWTQEEARNHGAWAALREPLEEVLPAGTRLRCAARTATPASAGCRRSVHASEEQALIAAALRGRP
ncbi:MAG TPA: 2-oxoglutarate dehydrogenase E1 component [Burkholderiaceae bacterium]|jgi:2-oxoglutarate dehydrogenase E1 component|nr:2-oxoglutarate dehydrogenase E1 component [Burkholderiaceae bacterium]